MTDTDFDDIVANLDMNIEVDKTGTLDVRALDNLELVRRNEKVRQELISLGELTVENPTTQRARDLHSERVALMVEMARRGFR